MRYSTLVSLLAAICVKATFLSEDPNQSNFQDGSYSYDLFADSTGSTDSTDSTDSTYLADLMDLTGSAGSTGSTDSTYLTDWTDSTDPTSNYDQALFNLDAPFDSDLPWDLSDQWLLDSEEDTAAEISDALALTCGSDNTWNKSKLRKRDGARCTPNDAPHGSTDVKMPGLSDIEDAVHQKPTIAPDQDLPIAKPGIDEDNNDYCTPPYPYSVCCRGLQFRVIDPVGNLPTFTVMPGCTLSEFK